MSGFWARLREVRIAFAEDDCLLAGAAIAYYALLSIFPFLLTVIAISTQVIDFERVRLAVEDALRAYLPPRSQAIILRNVEEAIRLRGPAGIVAVITFLWSSSAAVGAMRKTFNRIWDAEEARPFVMGKALDIAMSLLLGAVLGSLAAAAIGLETLAGLGLRLDILETGAAVTVVPILQEAGTFVLIFVAFHIMYSILPNRRIGWRDVWPGALAAAILLEVARYVVFWAVSRFAQYHLVYGSIAGIVVFMLWMYLVAVILLLGAEIARRARSRA